MFKQKKSTQYQTSLSSLNSQRSFSSNNNLSSNRGKTSNRSIGKKQMKKIT